MKMYKEHYKHAKTNVRQYDKEFKKHVISIISNLKEIGLTWEEIENEIKSMYGIKDVSTFRKEYHTLVTNGNITCNIDTPASIALLAKAKNKILVDRKINTKQRNLLNYETNVIAFRHMIVDAIKEHRWVTYTRYDKPVKPLSDNTQCVYIISDEHFRGVVDVIHLNNIYDQIEKDILFNAYKNIEIWYLGDGIDGLLHLSSLSTNDGAVKPAIQYANILVERLNKIKQLSAIKFVIESNHNQTRPLNTTRNQLCREDLSYTIVALLEMGLRKNIDIKANWKLEFMYHGLNVLLLHGHQDYTIKKEKFLSTLQSQGDNTDIICIGHWHEYKVHGYGKNKWLFVAPTAKVWDGDYEKNKGFVSQGLITKLVVEDKLPSFTPIDVKEYK